VREQAQPRILLTRTSHIGDCVLTLPMLVALRDHFPNALIVWAVECPSDQFLRHHEAIDHVIPLHRGWLRRPSDVWKLRQELLGFDFNMSIDSQSRTRSSTIAWLARAPRRLGWKYPAGKDFALVFNNERYESKQRHLVDRQLDLLRPLGIADQPVRFDFPVREQAIQSIDQFLGQRTDRREFVAMNPGAGWFSRRWPAQRYGKVARFLRDRYQLTSLVTWAGADERELALSAIRAADGAAIIAPATSLNELAALLRRAKFYFGSDTGPMHVANAVGTPCVGLFGPTRPEFSGAYGPLNEHVQAFYQGGGGMVRRRAGNQSMLSIRTHSACDACDRMMTKLVDHPQNQVA